MSKNKKKIPVPEPESDDEYICPAASWGDRTGIIPYSAEDMMERASYDEVHPFLHEYEGD
ncbi:hypothetical protein [uncultured Ruminococcus sp.]|uniref:hypothetical protein n=1 Tax=uncultured Ruminococcus sp. TaxID=165186 RepID=UPI0025FFC88F|nr:hypothetical protein [uncultured Ruminococcus sp.]